MSDRVGRSRIWFRPFFRLDTGAAIAEFAVAMGVFFLIVVVILQFGYAAWERNSLASDAREGARWASVRGGSSGRQTNQSAIQTYLRSKSSLGSSIIVEAHWGYNGANADGTQPPGSVVTVTVSHVSRGKKFLPDSVSSSSSMIVVY